MRDENRWDLLVLGGGTAGIVGAKTAAGLGASVVLVESDRTGGDCLWTGCVPSKALIAAASHVAAARNAAEFGVRVSGVEVDFPAVLNHVNRSIATIEPVDSPAALEQAGVTVVHGAGRFLSASRAAVGEDQLQFRQALIATGAAPTMPPIPGLRESGPLTSDSIWSLSALPRRLVVMGGGSIGCELSQAFARLGSAVTLVEALPRLIPREDPDAGHLVHRALVRDGVEVLVGHRVTKVVGTPGHPGEIHVDDGGAERTLEYDGLLVAVGRSPRSADLGLEEAGIETDGRGFITVNDRLRTSHPRIWAAGDVTPHPQFTHVAGVHGSLAASNAVLGLRRSIDVRAIPRVTYTDPEVASVGASSGEDDTAKDSRHVTRQHAEVDRAVTENRTDGFARLVLDRKRRVIGATIVGPRAGESLAEITLAVRKHMAVASIASTMHAYPTYGDGPWNAAISDVRAHFAEPLAARLTSLFLRGRRRWIDVRGSGR